MNKLFISFFIIVLLSGCSEQPSTISKYDERGLYSADLSKNANNLIISTVDHSAQLWDFKNNKKLHSWKHGDGNSSNKNLSHVAITGNGALAVTVSGNEISIWDTKTGKSKGFWKTKNYITKIKISDTGQYALFSDTARNAQLIDLINGLLVWKAKHESYIESIALSKDLKYAVVGCEDTSITVWDIKKSKKDNLFFEKSKVRHLAISDDNKIVISSTPFNPISVWDLTTGKLKFNLREITGVLESFSRPIIHISSISFSKDNKYAVTGSPPRNLHVWDMTTGKLKYKFIIPKHKVWKPSSNIVYAISFSDDDKTIYAISSNGFGYSWKLDSNE